MPEVTKEEFDRLEKRLNNAVLAMREQNDAIRYVVEALQVINSLLEEGPNSASQ